MASTVIAPTPSSPAADGDATGVGAGGPIVGPPPGGTFAPEPGVPPAGAGVATTGGAATDTKGSP